MSESEENAGFQSNDQSGTEDETINQIKNDDGFLALIILIVAVVLVIVIGFYFWKKNSAPKDTSWKQTAFTPPPERQAFLEGKKKLNPNNVTELDELKKLLMRRAIQTIPYLLSLQNEGSSIERLYKRGMLTDDMHFKVKELKAFVDKEFQDVQLEADELVPEWGQHIWPQAMQFHQMIQKQAEGKSDEQKTSEDDKKKSDAQKKKEKSKKAKAAVNNSNANGGEEGSKGGDGESTSSPPSSSSATSTTEVSVTSSRAIDDLDPATAKAKEAERMAQLLLEEEEREKKKGSTSGKKKGGKK